MGQFMGTQKSKSIQVFRIWIFQCQIVSTQEETSPTVCWKLPAVKRCSWQRKFLRRHVRGCRHGVDDLFLGAMWSKRVIRHAQSATSLRDSVAQVQHLLWLPLSTLSHSGNNMSVNLATIANLWFMGCWLCWEAMTSCQPTKPPWHQTFYIIYCIGRQSFYCNHIPFISFHDLSWLSLGYFLVTCHILTALPPVAERQLSWNMFIRYWYDIYKYSEPKWPLFWLALESLSLKLDNEKCMYKIGSSILVHCSHARWVILSWVNSIGRFNGLFCTHVRVLP